jgi:hypothetical protein
LLPEVHCTAKPPFPRLQVQTTHALLVTLCKTTDARKALREADAVSMLVAALEKQRPVAELDVKGRIAGKRYHCLLYLCLTPIIQVAGQHASCSFLRTQVLHHW